MNASRMFVGRWRSLGALLVCLAAGCSRHHYHTAADSEVTDLVAEKAGEASCHIPCFNVNMDPRSRFREVYDQDKPPMPSDDPAAHRLMHVIDGKKAYPHWHKYGDRPDLESPFWREQLGEYAEITPTGEIKLSLETSVDLARIHSPNYQSNIESLYLSALDVSTERFRFDVKFLQSFSGGDVAFLHLGRKRRAPFGSDSLNLNTDLRLQRRFATAGELLVGFANSTVFQFAGPDMHTTVSILNFSLVQPLLQFGGRAVGLEQLTIVERALLSNLRAFQRYRQGFYTQLAVGDGGVQGPQRRGGFFGGTGLTGFTGTGAGGVGGVGEQTFRNAANNGGGGGGGSGAGFAGGGAGAVGGYVGLLQSLQEIRNSEENLRVQLRTRDLLEEFYKAGDIRRGQVDQFRQNLETERANLLQSRNNLENSLDNYKLLLGLPPDLVFDLDDTLIRQFQFIDPKFTTLEGQLGQFQERLGKLPDEPTLADLQRALAEAAEVRQALAPLPDVVEKDLQRWAERQGKRKDKSTSDDLENAQESLANARQALAAADKKLATIRTGLAAGTRKKSYGELVRWIRELVQVLQDLSLVQARSRLEGLENIEELTLGSEESLRIARARRLDWMNNRSALVDTWRLIEFNANALESNLTVTFSGDLQTTDDKPFRFRGPTGSMQAGLQFDAPFNRLLERNNYRQSLIDYQRDRRQLVQFEDNIHRSLRQLLRRLEQLRENLEIQRRAGALAIRRVDEMFETLNEPPQPGQPRQLPPVFDLLTALSDLRSTQNNLMSVWLNYYATRMLLYRELGVMELDDRGNWLDRPLDEYRCDGGACCELPPEIPEQWMRDSDRACGHDAGGADAPLPPAPGQGGPGPRFMPPLPRAPTMALPPTMPSAPALPGPGGAAPIQARSLGSPPMAAGAPSTRDVPHVARRHAADKLPSVAADPPPPGWPSILPPPIVR